MKIPAINEYLSPAQVQGICKMANIHPEPDVDEDDVPKVRDWARTAKLVGASALGMGMGTLGGYGIGRLADHVHGSRIPMSVVSRLLPPAVLGAGSALAYSLWKAREAEELKHALKPDPNYQPPGK